VLVDAGGMKTELAQRENEGISVTLFWYRETNRLTVAVRDRRTGKAFDLEAPALTAMDVFNHPYAYAARLAA
jgi:hypothetical protein